MTDNVTHLALHAIEKNKERLGEISAQLVLLLREGIELSHAKNMTLILCRDDGTPTHRVDITHLETPSDD